MGGGTVRTEERSTHKQILWKSWTWMETRLLIKLYYDLLIVSHFFSLFEIYNKNLASLLQVLLKPIIIHPKPKFHNYPHPPTSVLVRITPSSDYNSAQSLFSQYLTTHENVP